ncbi:MAG TPA: AAA family ATPase [Actinomycetes bacterium]|nr:AAA family ATPase [Actinomycetes bacterium]
MARLIHLNGPPGIGKSTISRMYADAHTGVLNLDIDMLRTLIGGWQRDFEHAGELIRPAALAMIAGYLPTGNDVVLPSLLVRLDELQRFESAAVEVGAEFQEIFLMDSKARCLSRFHMRGVNGQDADPWHNQVRALVESQGGDDVLAQYYDDLVALIAKREKAIVIETTVGCIDQTYSAVLNALTPDARNV